MPVDPIARNSNNEVNRIAIALQKQNSILNQIGFSNLLTVPQLVRISPRRNASKRRVSRHPPKAAAPETLNDRCSKQNDSTNPARKRNRAIQKATCHAVIRASSPSAVIWVRFTLFGRSSNEEINSMATRNNVGVHPVAAFD